jgi:phosphoglycolate phosphatase-like HAD superfamily hydrolase
VISAVIFDLDGTLLGTEELKGLSYARAAELRPDTMREDDVLAAHTDDDLVGHPSQEVATPSCSATQRWADGPPPPTTFSKR